MNKSDKTFIIGIILAGVILGFGLYSLFINNNVNNYYQIKVNTNGGVPYSWEYKIDNENIVEIKQSSKALNKNEGGPVEVYFDITAKKEGNATLTLEYKDVRDQHVEKEEIYQIEVTHDLKMNIQDN